MESHYNKASEKSQTVSAVYTLVWLMCIYPKIIVNVLNAAYIEVSLIMCKRATFPETQQDIVYVTASALRPVNSTGTVHPLQLACGFFKVVFRWSAASFETKDNFIMYTSNQRWNLTLK